MTARNISCPNKTKSEINSNHITATERNYRMAIRLNLDLLISSLNQDRGKTMRGFSDKWSCIVNSDSIEHLTIPRLLLFGWGTMLLALQTLAILVNLEIVIHIVGWMWLFLFLLFRQYCRVWKRYYSLFWPIFVHAAALVTAIYIKVRYL